MQYEKKEPDVKSFAENLLPFSQNYCQKFWEQLRTRIMRVRVSVWVVKPRGLRLDNAIFGLSGDQTKTLGVSIVSPTEY